MARDLASIVLTGLDSNLRAIDLAGAAKARRRARQDQSLVDFGHSLIEIPSLIRKRKEEDEIKSVDDAFSGALLAGGDLDTAAGAMRNLKPMTRGGAKHLGERALALETLRQQRQAHAKDVVAAEAERRTRTAMAKIAKGKRVAGSG